MKCLTYGKLLFIIDTTKGDIMLNKKYYFTDEYFYGYYFERENSDFAVRN